MTKSLGRGLLGRVGVGSSEMGMLVLNSSMLVAADMTGNTTRMRKVIGMGDVAISQDEQQ